MVLPLVAVDLWKDLKFSYKLAQEYISNLQDPVYTSMMQTHTIMWCSNTHVQM